MSFKRVVICAALLVSHAAQAEVTTLYQVGPWRAFGGRSDANTEMCGVSTIGSDRSFLVKWFKGNPNFTIHMFKNGWNIPLNLPVDVSIKFDNETPWFGKASGNGSQGLELNVTSSAFDKFFAELRYSAFFEIKFPSGSEVAWRGGLAGSNGAVLRMMQCIRERSNPPQTTPTQPYAPNHNPTTQPYVPNATPNRHVGEERII